MPPDDREPAHPAPGSPQRLESWKEIARHLDRQVRTVQRWEKSEGLPVHRHRHQSGGSVYALTEELDAWRARRTTGPAPEPPPSPGPATPDHVTGPPRPRPALVVAGMLTLAMGLALGLSLWGESAGSASEDRPDDVAPELVEAGRTRLVVLPLKALGEASIDAALQEGLHEEIIHQLARLDPERLAVIGRTSSILYRSRSRSLAEIGHELDVSHAVEGAVQVEGDRLRIRMRLVRTQEQDHLWAQAADLRLDSVLDAQQTVATQVSDAVARLLLEAPRPAGLTAATTSDERAAEQFRRGRSLLHEGTEDGITASIGCFERALEFDEAFVDAHSSRALAHALLGRYGLRPPRESFPLARESARRALERDPDHGEAIAVEALIQFYGDWDFDAAEATFLRAIQRDPGNALPHHWYAHFLSAMSRHDEAIAQAATAQRLEPLGPLVNADAGWFFYRARRYEEAIVQCRKSLEIEPFFASASSCIVSCLQRLGRSDEAWAEMRRFLQAKGTLEEIPTLAALDDQDPEACIHAALGHRLDQLSALAEERYVPPYSFTFLHVARGDVEASFEWLRRAIETRDRAALLLACHPSFDPLRDDPRHAAMLAEIGLPLAEGPR